MGISDLRQRINAYVADLDTHIEEALNTADQEFTDLNREQMLAFKRADDATITPPYSPGYAKQKGHPNPNLKLTGAFQYDMFFMAQNGQFFVTSSDDKMTSLVTRYSEKIFGIAPSKLQRARTIAHRVMVDSFNKNVLNG